MGNCKAGDRQGGHRFEVSAEGPSGFSGEVSEGLGSRLLVHLGQGDNSVVGVGVVRGAQLAQRECRSVCRGRLDLL